MLLENYLGGEVIVKLMRKVVNLKRIVKLLVRKGDKIWIEKM